MQHEPCKKKDDTPYLDSIGVLCVFGARGWVIDRIASITAGLITSQFKEWPVALVEAKGVLLVAGETVLTLQSQTPQGLCVQAAQLSIDTFPIVYVAQEGVELDVGAGAGHAELGGGGERCPTLVPQTQPALVSASHLFHSPRAQLLAKRGVAPLKGLVRRIQVPLIHRARGGAELWPVLPIDIAFWVTEDQMGAAPGMSGTPASRLIWSWHGPVHHLLLWERGRQEGVAIADCGVVRLWGNRGGGEPILAKMGRTWRKSTFMT